MAPTAFAESRTFLALHPLVPAAVLFSLGLALGAATRWPVVYDLLALTVSLCVWWIADIRAWRCLVLAQMTLAFALLAAGSAWWRVDQQYVERRHLVRLLPSSADNPPVLLTARLRLLTDPQQNPAPADLPFYAARPTQHVVAEVIAVETRNGWTPACGLVTVTLPAAPPLAAGQRVELCGWAGRPRGPLNPGEFDYRRYLAASRLFAHLSAARPEQLRPLAAESWAGPAAWLDRFRLFLRHRLLAFVAPLDMDAGNTLVALLLGDRSPGLQPISQAFTDAGVAHLLAISGSHIVLIAGILWWCLRPVAGRPRWRAVITACLVGVYMAATPAGPPILRAGLAMMLLLTSRLLARPPRGLHLLAATWLAVLLLRPADLFDAGCQLSFATTAGLILLAPRFYRGLFGAWLERQAAVARAIGTRRAWLWLSIWRFMGAMFTANAIGACAAVPLVAYHFHQVNPLAVFSGMLLLPCVTLLIVAAMIQLLAALLIPALASFLAPVVVMLTRGSLEIVDFLASLPGATVNVRPPPVFILVMIFLVVMLWLVRRPFGISRATVAVAGVAVLTLMAGWSALTQHHGELRLWRLAVGRGSCLVMEGPDGQSLIINAGSRNRSGIGWRVVEPLLRVEGISPGAGIVVTQLSDECCSAVVGMTAHHGPAFIACSEQEARQSASSYAAGRFFRQVAQRRLPFRLLHAGDRLPLGPRGACTVLWPPARPLPGLSARQRGMVLLLSCHGRRLLLVGSQQDAPIVLLASTGVLEGVREALIMDSGPPSVSLQVALEAADIRRIDVAADEEKDGTLGGEGEGTVFGVGFHRTLALRLSAKGVVRDP